MTIAGHLANHSSAHRLFLYFLNFFTSWFTKTHSIALCWTSGIFIRRTFRFYSFDFNFNRTFLFALEVMNFYDFEEHGHDFWFEAFPFLEEYGLGTYFQKINLIDGVRVSEFISKERFLDMFHEMVGFPFENYAESKLFLNPSETQ